MFEFFRNLSNDEDEKIFLQSQLDALRVHHLKEDKRRREQTRHDLKMFDARGGRVRQHLHFEYLRTHNQDQVRLLDTLPAVVVAPKKAKGSLKNGLKKLAKVFAL